MYDICVIGGGPAGISSAVYAVSRGLKTIMLEQKAVGGLVGSVSTVTHYAGIINGETGNTFAQRLKEQALSAGVEIVMERVERAKLDGAVKVITTDKNTYEAKAVIIAAGTTARTLGIPGEEEFAGHGTKLNAARDGEKYAGKEMFVVGGADGAIKEALYLAKYAEKLTIIHFEDKLGTISEFMEKVEKTENIQVLLHKRLSEIRGDGQADELVLTDEHTGEQTVVHAPGCGIFIYAGSTPNTQLYPELETDGGYLVTDAMQRTNIAGVYAAGDICVKQVRQAATAVADGAVAAINAAAYVKAM